MRLSCCLRPAFVPGSWRIRCSAPHGPAVTFATSGSLDPVINRLPSNGWQQCALPSCDTARERHVPRDNLLTCQFNPSVDTRIPCCAIRPAFAFQPGLSLFLVAPIARREQGIDWMLVARHISHYAVPRPFPKGSGSGTRCLRSANDVWRRPAGQHPDMPYQHIRVSRASHRTRARLPMMWRFLRPKLGRLMEVRYLHPTSHHLEVKPSSTSESHPRPRNVPARGQ